MLAGACVLAGGLSRRFGSDKAVHPVDGQPMLLRVAAALAVAGAEVFVMSRHVRGVALREVIEMDGPRHPLWGVAEALRHAGGDVLFSPCDLPHLEPDHVRRLLAAGVPAHAQGQPLFCVVAGGQAELAAQWAREGRSVQSFMSATQSRPVVLGELLNLNRPTAAGGG